jgi:hypothetical protein
VSEIGVDEKAFRKGHSYLTLVNDLIRDGMRRPASTGCDKLPHTHSRCKGDRP